MVFFPLIIRIIQVIVKGFTYDASLTNRNLILSSLQQLRNVIYNTTDTSIKNKYNNWINLRATTFFLVHKANC